MADDYYPGGGADSGSGDTGTDDGGSSDASDNAPDDKAEGESCLVPKTIFSGKEINPGDECMFKVVKDYGDEIEVAYVGDDKSESSESSPAMGEAMSGMDSMASADAGE